MSRISYNRLKMLFKHEWSMNWQEKMYLAILAFTMPFAIATVYSILPMALMQLMLMGTILIITIAPSYFASHTFANMRNKQQRIAFLMLPATNEEKFIVRLIDYAILPSVIIVTSTFMAGLLALIIHDTTFIKDLKEALAFQKEAMPIEIAKIAVLGTLYVITSWAKQMSIMTLGGLIFGKRAVVKTFLVEIAFYILFARTIFSCLDYMWISETVGLMLLIVTNVIIALCCIIVSYLLFKRRQII